METLGLIVVTEQRVERGFAAPHGPELSRHTRMFLPGHERRESAGGAFVFLSQPDQRRQVTLNTEQRTYTVRPMLHLSTQPEKQRWMRMAARAPHRQRPSPSTTGAYTISSHIEKTDERAVFFGFPSVRYITRQNYIYPDANVHPQEAITDGWYLDSQHPALPRDGYPLGIMYVSSGGTRPDIHRTGELRYCGIPLRTVTTTRETSPVAEPPQEFVFRQTTEVTRLEECTPDPALFEIPPGYRESPLLPTGWQRRALQLQRALRRMLTS